MPVRHWENKCWNWRNFVMKLRSVQPSMWVLTPLFNPSFTADAISSIVRFRIPQGDRPSMDEIRSLGAGVTGLTGLMSLMERCWEAKPSHRPSSLGKNSFSHSNKGNISLSVLCAPTWHIYVVCRMYNGDRRNVQDAQTCNSRCSPSSFEKTGEERCHSETSEKFLA